MIMEIFFLVSLFIVSNIADMQLQLQRKVGCHGPRVLFHPLLQTHPAWGLSPLLPDLVSGVPASQHF